jgi:hypothetical protein
MQSNRGWAMALMVTAVITGVSAAAAAETEAATASVGEQGRDLTPRFTIQPGGPTGPAASLEFRGAFGDDLALLGPAAVNYRMQPEIIGHVTPTVGARLMAGGGIGTAYVVDGVCSESSGVPCDGLVQKEHVELTFSGAIGVELTVARMPVFAVLRTDAIAARSWATTVELGFEIPEAH